MEAGEMHNILCMYYIYIMFVTLSNFLFDKFK